MGKDSKFIAGAIAGGLITYIAMKNYHYNCNRVQNQHNTITNLATQKKLLLSDKTKGY